MKTSERSQNFLLFSQKLKGILQNDAILRQTGGERVAMKAFLLARVSSKDQQDNNSIPAQTRRLKEYAERRNLQVVETFQLVESSTRQNRRKFEEILSRIQQSQETIALVTDTIDRLQRDFKETVMLNEHLRNGSLELHFLRENLVIHKDSNSSDIQRWDIGVVFAKGYVTQLSDNVKRSQEQKILDGEWPTKAPFGYRNVKVNGKTTVVPHELEALAVADAFADYATGTLSLQGISERLRVKYQLEMGTTQLHNMLRKRFYHGEMEWNGKLHPHGYEKLIERSQYDEVQRVLDGYHKKPRRWAGLDYRYRGLITCAECGCRITFELKKKKYLYGHCTQFGGKHGAKYVNENKITEQLANVFTSFSLTNEEYEEVSKIVQKHFRSHQSNAKKEQASLKKKIKQYDKRIDNLIDAYTEDLVDKETYKDKLSQYKESKQQLENRLNTFELDKNDQLGTVSHLLKLSNEAPELFKKANTVQTRQLVNLTLSNLELDGEELRWELKKPFEKMAFCKKYQSWLGWQDSNLRMLGPKPSALPLGYTPLVAIIPELVFRVDII